MTVILSAARASRSEALAESKDPYFHSAPPRNVFPRDYPYAFASSRNPSLIGGR